MCLVPDEILTCAVFIMTELLFGQCELEAATCLLQESRLLMPHLSLSLLFIGLKCGCRVSQSALDMLSVARTSIFLSGCFILIVDKLST